MKSRMLIILLLLGLVVPSAALASDKILLLDDIGEGDATFAFEKDSKGGVALIAKVAQDDCIDPHCMEYMYFSTGPLKDFSLENREVYFNDGGTPVFCGKTQGIFQSSQILSPCQVFVSPELMCEEWYRDEDCARTATKYRVYLTIQ